MKNVSDEILAEQHSPEQIALRINRQHQHSDLGDVMLGAVDGTVTTFAIVSGVAGTGLEQGVLVAFVLGLANVVADGFSMGASNLLKSRSDLQVIQNYRDLEELHIDRVPDSEREEIRQIYRKKGFDGDLLENIVQTICSDRNKWVDTMLVEEWGLNLAPTSPLRSASLTFLAFISAGLIPLLPLLLGLVSDIDAQSIFLISAAATAFTFLLTGAARGRYLERSIVLSSLETLAVGGSAAAIAYGLGHAFAFLLL